MSDTMISCTCCGYQIVFPEDASTLRCPACQTNNARPRSTGDTLLTLQRAVDQRLACDFHNAELSYQQVLLYRPDEHEALWGRLLCHYGVEYVVDPATKRRMPTVHTVHARPLQEQPDFLRACQIAPEEIRAQYEEEAAYIDSAQAHIRQLALSCQPYDVFLCHKTTKPGSDDYTQDFHRATQLYHFLKDQGMQVFFAPECLQSAAGSNYEAGIYHALHTAKVMLLVCSEAEYLTSAWVRSEWTRFMELAESDPNRHLLPLLYDHFSPADLPQQFLFRSIQGLDMTSITAAQTLLERMKQILAPQTVPADEEPRAVQAPRQTSPAAPRANPAAANTEPCVTLHFPGLRNHWKKKPTWVILDSNKTLLTTISWDSSKKVRLHHKHEILQICEENTLKGRLFVRVVSSIALVFFLIMSLSGIGMYMGDSDFLIITVVALGFLIASLYGFLRSKKYYLKCHHAVSAGKSYRFSWPAKKRNQQFIIEEI